MEVHNALYSNSRPFESVFFSPYNTPPYITPYWSSDINALEEVKHFQHMQHIRFPTPPITPPRLGSQHVSEAHQPASSQRTESVIMKVEQGKQSAHIIRAEIYPIDEHKLSDCSSGSSAAASPSTDFVCNWTDCGRYFECLDALALHVTQQHAVASVTDGLYYCRWSGCLRSERGFNARYKMLVHVRTHTKEKPHQCHLCEKSFSRAENLKIHIRSHSGEKPYKCTFEGCQKAYSNSSDRFKHTRTHSMEKPYMCKVPGCQKRYTDPSSLRKHVKTFKHGEQLMPSQINNATDVSLQKHRLYETEGPFICDVASAAQYYIDVASDYKVNPIDYAPRYWLPSAESNIPATNYNTSDYTEDLLMDTELNTPLDLRVHRG